MLKEVLKEFSDYSGIISRSRRQKETDAIRKVHSTLDILIHKKRLQIEAKRRTDLKKKHQY